MDGDLVGDMQATSQLALTNYFCLRPTGIQYTRNGRQVKKGSPNHRCQLSRTLLATAHRHRRMNEQPPSIDLQLVILQYNNFYWWLRFRQSERPFSEIGRSTLPRPTSPTPSFILYACLCRPIIHALETIRISYLGWCWTFIGRDGRVLMQHIGSAHVSVSLDIPLFAYGS